MRPSVLDIGIAGTLAALSGLSLAVEDAPAVVVGAQVLSALALAFRRAAPVGPAVVMLLASATMVAATGDGPDNIFFIVIWVIGAYSTGAYLPWPQTVAALMLWSVALLVSEGTGLEWGDVLFLAALTASAWFPGVLAARSRDAQEATSAVARLQSEKAAVAVLDERARIARELHDVVAHAVGIMVVQAGAAAHVLERDPARARQALEAVQETGHNAVLELTRMLALLRDDAPGDLRPLPSIAALPDLVEAVERAGVSVDVDMAGELTGLPPAVDLSVYRVVQEALTNAVKHARGSHVHVTVTQARNTIDIEVVDDGPQGHAPAAVDAGSGLGLIGLRERVSVFGGRLDAGPRPSGGFRVSARLPVPGAAP